MIDRDFFCISHRFLLLLRKALHIIPLTFESKLTLKKNDISGFFLFSVSGMPFEDFYTQNYGSFSLFVKCGLRDEVYAEYRTCSDILLNQELGTCLSDSVP